MYARCIYILLGQYFNNFLSIKYFFCQKSLLVRSRMLIKRLRLSNNLEAVQMELYIISGCNNILKHLTYIQNQNENWFYALKLVFYS